ncbi:hypothetical protein [Methyloversatilis sp. NSM2]|uniref:hypothetical protein n=1 Tax=Methyloversatilis sp. NSM2 TaxID=3134135 RepID=UPI00310F7EC9
MAAGWRFTEFRRLSVSCGPAVIAGTLINYQAAEPVLRRLAEAAVTSTLFLPGRYHDFVRARWASMDGLHLRPHEVLSAAAPLARLVHHVLEPMLAGPAFSDTYRFREWPRLAAHSAAARALLAARAALPGMPRGAINAALQRAVHPLLPRGVLPEGGPVLAVTRSDVRHLLCAGGLDVVSLMESWDHPPKAPMGYQSRTAFVWNAATREDWVEFQGGEDVRVAYPFKLRYALENPVQSSEGDLVLYPATFSARSDPAFFSAELTLLDHLCRAARTAGMRLLVKPKPNGLEGEFASLLARHPGVELAPYKDNDGSTGYFLDEAYNRQRLDLLARCALVVNLGTTFALDAAAAGVPVLQLRLDDAPRFPLLSQADRWVHLQRHFLSRPDLLCRIGEGDDVDARLADGLSGEGHRARAFSDHLRGWLSGAGGASRAIDDIAARLLQGGRP